MAEQRLDRREYKVPGLRRKGTEQGQHNSRDLARLRIRNTEPVGLEHESESRELESGWLDKFMGYNLSSTSRTVVKGLGVWGSS